MLISGRSFSVFNSQVNFGSRWRDKLRRVVCSCCLPSANSNENKESFWARQERNSPFDSGSTDADAVLSS
jgi:hypothetical protein